MWLRNYQISRVGTRKSATINQASYYQSLDSDCVSGGGEDGIHLSDSKGAGLTKEITNGNRGSLVILFNNI